jgi:transcriptional regulator with XRE-family HTH domain
MAGMLRGMTGLSQRRFAEEVGLQPRQISGIEGGQVEPTPQDLQRIAQGAGLTVADADELLRYGEALARYRRRQDQGSEEALPALMDRLKLQLSRSFLRLLALPGPGSGPQAGEHRAVEELMARLRVCSPEVRVWIVRTAEEFQGWELYERVREEAGQEALRNSEEAAAWAQLAAEIAAQLQEACGADKTFSRCLE